MIRCKTLKTYGTLWDCGTFPNFAIKINGLHCPNICLHVSHNVLFWDTNLKNIVGQKRPSVLSDTGPFSRVVSGLIVFEKEFYAILSLLGFELVLAIPDGMIESQLWYLNPATHGTIP